VPLRGRGAVAPRAWCVCVQALRLLFLPVLPRGPSVFASGLVKIWTTKGEVSLTPRRSWPAKPIRACWKILTSSPSSPTPMFGADRSRGIGWEFET